MANGHGGYRQPSNPAPVSGPGAMSRRTDGGPVTELPNAGYGEGKEFRELQQAAPVSASPGGQQAATFDPSMLPTGFGAETEMPDVPVTAGADAGAGPGSQALGLTAEGGEVEDLRRRYGAYLPLLIRKADHPSSSQEFRDQVRYLISKIG
jgi:hypothetical protein